MVFGYISIDVVQAAVADLNVDLALEYCSQKLDECGYDRGARSARKSRQDTEAGDPRGDVPMRGATALVCGFAHPLEYHEKLVAVTIRQEQPDAAHQVIHVQGHEVSTSPDTLQVGLHEIRAEEFPLRRRNGDEQIRVGAKPYLPTEPTQHAAIRLDQLYRQRILEQGGARILKRQSGLVTVLGEKGAQ